MPATGWERDARSIIERQPPQTLAIEDEPFDSVMSETTRMVYGKLLGGHHRHQGALGEHAVADLATALAHDPAGLTHRVGREVVVEVEVLLVLLLDAIDDLLVVGRAERRADQGLGLTAREEHGAVLARVEVRAIVISRMSSHLRPSMRVRRGSPRARPSS